MNRLNGWQRMWVVIAVLWGAIVLQWHFQSGDMPKTPRHLLLHITNWTAVWAAPLITIYLLGLGVAWVRAGFRKDRTIRAHRETAAERSLDCHREGRR